MTTTTSLPITLLKPVVRLREFPFGTVGDPSMRNFLAEAPWPHQEEVLAYLRSGLILGVTMGADLTDWLDRSHKANPVIDGRPEGGTTEMTDGTWFWYAGLIYFIPSSLQPPHAGGVHSARRPCRLARRSRTHPTGSLRLLLPR